MTPGAEVFVVRRGHIIHVVKMHYIFYPINIQHFDCYCIKGLWYCFPIPLLNLIYTMMGQLICIYEPSDKKSTWSLWYTGDRSFLWASCSIRHMNFNFLGKKITIRSSNIFIHTYHNSFAGPLFSIWITGVHVFKILYLKKERVTFFFLPYSQMN